MDITQGKNNGGEAARVAAVRFLRQRNQNYMDRPIRIALPEFTAAYLALTKEQRKQFKHLFNRRYQRRVPLSEAVP